jgi:hypothetical protein
MLMGDEERWRFGEHQRRYELTVLIQFHISANGLITWSLPIMGKYCLSLGNSVERHVLFTFTMPSPVFAAMHKDIKRTPKIDPRKSPSPKNNKFIKVLLLSVVLINSFLFLKCYFKNQLNLYINYAMIMP